MGETINITDKVESTPNIITDKSNEETTNLITDKCYEETTNIITDKCYDETTNIITDKSIEETTNEITEKCIEETAVVIDQVIQNLDKPSEEVSNSYATDVKISDISIEDIPFFFSYGIENLGEI